MSTHTTRRRYGRIAVAATAVVVAAGLAPGVAQAADVTEGTLDWGVKESFRNYVTGPIGGGQITVLDGAVQNGDGTFGFTSATGDHDESNHDLDLTFDGGVRFQAHGSGDDWALDLTIENLTIDTDNAAGAGVLVADVTSKDMDSGDFVEYPQVALADLDVTGADYVVDGDVLTATGIASILSEDGAPAFGGFYTPGTELDPVAVTVGTGSGGGGPGESGVTDGNLDWGVKESFRNYVVGPIANGRIELSDGAEDLDGAYRFPGGAGDYADGDVDVTFAGAVRFLGHEHDGSYELDLTVTDLRLTASGDDGVLYVGDVALADVDTSGFETSDGVASLVDATVLLTADGAEYFGGFYEAGTELDPLTVHLALDADATLPGGGPGGDKGNVGGPSLAMTGSSLTGLLAAGLALLIAGAVAFWVTRRRAEGTTA